MKILELGREITFTYHDLTTNEVIRAVDFAPYEGIEIVAGDVAYKIDFRNGGLRVLVYGPRVEHVNIIPNSGSEFLVKPTMWQPPVEKEARP